MEIKVKGQMTLGELRQALYETLTELENTFAIAHSYGATLYVNPINAEGETVIAKGKDGRAVQRLTSNGPYRSAADQFNI